MYFRLKLSRINSYIPKKYPNIKRVYTVCEWPNPHIGAPRAGPRGRERGARQLVRKVRLLP